MHFLGIDYGSKRIGLSFGDHLGVAVPLPAAVAETLEDRLRFIADTIQKRRIQELVVGYPYNMDGSVGFKAKEVDLFITTLESRFNLPVHRIDERLSSQQAASDNKQFNKQKKLNIKDLQAERRTGKLDSQAATLILQDYLTLRYNLTLLPSEEEEEDL